MSGASLRVFEGCMGRILAARLDRGEDLMLSVRKIATEHKIMPSFFIVMGALLRARIGFYVGGGRYEVMEIDEETELASCIGNVIPSSEGDVIVHGHIVVATRDGKAIGGHMLEGCVISVTGELMMFELKDVSVVRRIDTETGLYLMGAG